MPQEVNVGLIGYSFMGKVHSHAFKDMSFFFPEAAAYPVMKAICGRNEANVSDAAKTFGWQSYETDWKTLIGRDDIHLIDVSTPGDSHAEIAIAAAEAGKHVFCEKPLANNLAEARAMADAVRNAGVKSMVAYNYRRVPAVALAKKLIEEGRIGDIYHWRAVYLQDWIMDPNFPLVWRLQKEKAGSGPHGDLNAHIIDLARYLVGDISEVSGMQETFIKERPIAEEIDAALGASTGGSNQMGQVTVDDTTLFLARFENGAVGTFEATRFAGGRRNGNRFEINGSKGSIAFNLEKMNELQYYNREDEDHIQGFRKIMVNEGVHPYMDHWWPPGHIIGWEHTFIHEVYDLMQAIGGADDNLHPDFDEGVKDQAVLEAVSISAENKSWIKVTDL
ncbi:MAG TPA: Gfo/Idh/MocA family oxidoreductase [candidate division Zixibacteria bacterium]|jgi:predicted dehydrogenase|nr:Gfo/Idh/MocA family oxidoreductase [candidate division Zixibacteria bacterium]